MQRDLGGNPLLEILDLQAGYGKSQVLKGLSLTVRSGEIVALVGANGAGKTTILRSILGFTTRTAGSIWFKGEEITHLSAHRIVQRGLGCVPQDGKVFPSLTVRDNLEMGGYDVSGAQLKTNLELVFNLFPVLRERIVQKARTLSGGERQMLGIGRGLMTNPELLLLDEPSLGLSPKLVHEIFEIIKRINTEEKTSMLLVEQNVKAALGIAEYGYVMENGRVVMDGQAEKLRDNEDIKEFYLGLSKVGQRRSYREVKHYKRRKRWLA